MILPTELVILKYEKMKHISIFKVENFKKFDILELTNIGQFNLIAGDNNVGKTSVLEALTFDDNNPNIFSKNLLYLLKLRNMGDKFKVPHLSFFISETQKSVFSIRYTDNSILFVSLFNDKVSYGSEKNYPNWVDCGLYDFSSLKNNFRIPFINTSLYSGNITDAYSTLLQDNVEQKNNFIEAIQILAPVQNIEISTKADPPILIIQQKNSNKMIPLSMLGEGTIKLYRILIEIIANRDKRLMIDEIDAGIHYSNMFSFLKAIIKTANENNVQLFFTTHNIELIEYFNTIFKDKDMVDLQSKVRHFEMLEHTKNNKIEVKAWGYDYAEFSQAIENKNNVRGGKI